MPETLPQNAGYMIAAYIVVAVIMVGYAASLFQRGRKL